MEGLKRYIREVPDWPKPGILFYDITTLLKDPVGLHHGVDALANHYVGRLIDRVVGVEARGFIFAPMVAYRLNAGFVPVRKPKKLPAATAQASYSLEYGKDALEMHRDVPRARVAVADHTNGARAAPLAAIGEFAAHR